MSRNYKVHSRVLKVDRKIPKLCPRCESPNIIHFELEHICHYCSWDSIELNADTDFSEMKNFAFDEDDSSHGYQERALELVRSLISEPLFESFGHAFV